MAPAMGQNVVEPPALEETHTELRVLEEDYAKDILLLPTLRAIVRMWTIYSSELAPWSSLCLLHAL